MKAFMSDSAVRESDWGRMYSLPGPLTATGGQILRAIGEASAILAETEPNTSDKAGCLQSHAYTLRGMRDGAAPGSLVHNASIALAETLAAFISLEIG